MARASFVLAALVDNSGYSLQSGKISGTVHYRDQAQLRKAPRSIPRYGFGFKDDKFVVMNVASADLLSVAHAERRSDQARGRR